MSTPATDPLGQAHAALRREALAARRDPVAQTFGAVIMRAVDEAAALRQAGADPAAVAAGLEAVVREHWVKPHGRTEPWRYLCEDCEDTGWRRQSCVGRGCGLANDRPHYPHEYVQPCWCDKGRARQPKAPAAVDTLASVGKVSKPTRWGK